MSPAITIFFGQTKINDVNEIAFFPQPHEKIIRLYISVNEVSSVDEFNSTDL